MKHCLHSMYSSANEQQTLTS